MSDTSALNFEAITPTTTPTNPEPTMSNISVFAFDSSAVRVNIRDGEPWFLAADVCAVLGIQNPTDALKRLDDDERARFNLGRLGDDEKGVISNDTLGGSQKMNFINESGLYSLILGSRKPEAKRFKKWVTSEVLPSIRKTGSYQGPNAAQQFPTQDSQMFLSHRADIFVAADRSFRAAMRSGRSAGLKMPQALRRANQIALEKTGIDMLVELRAEDHLADLEARAARPVSESTAPKSVQDFWHDWFSGQLGLPYQSCLTGQAYRAYQHWCKAVHARWLAQGDFTSHLLRHSSWHGQRLEQRGVRLNAGTTAGSTGRLLLVGELPFDEPIGIWASEQVRQFEKHLQQYCEK